MSPKKKTISVKAGSSKKSVPKTKGITPKKSPPKITKSKSGAIQKTPKIKKKVEPVLLACNFFSKESENSESEDLFASSDENSEKEDLLVSPTEEHDLLVSPTEEDENTEDDLLVSPTEEDENSEKKDRPVSPATMKYFLNAYKDSPDYHNLKKKRFNTGFIFEKRRGERDIQIWTPEEDKSPKWTENLPVVHNFIEGEPGEKYANIFMSIPGMDISDSDEEKDEELEPVVETERKSTDKKGRKKKQKK